MSKLKPIRQRRLNALHPEGWYEFTRRQRELGRTLEDVARIFSDIDRVPVRTSTLCIWIKNHEREQARQQAA